MILILCSWLLLFVVFTVYGTAARSFLKIDNAHLSITILLGTVLQTALLTTVAFFTSIGFWVFVANIFGTLLLGFWYRKRVGEALTSGLSEFRSFSKYSKAILMCTLITALFKCAQSPFILDNESYYVQTIKWLNEYGIVKGLANLNVAYGQTSPWHILQSGFNFSFWTERLNDINGFLLLCCSFFFLSEFERHWQTKKRFHWIGFLVFFDILSFQFINSPSPDIPLFLISQIILFLFLESNRSFSNAKIIILFFIFLVFLKITIAPLGILLLYLFYHERKSIVFAIYCGLAFGVLWLAKNSILSGYPFYPFEAFGLNVDWSIPKELQTFISDMIKEHEYRDLENYREMNLLQKFSAWISFGGINGIFNKGIIVLFALAPFTKLIRSARAYKIVYFGLLLHFIMVFVVSPQFRFFLAEFLFLTAVITSEIANRIHFPSKIIFAGLIVASLFPLPILFFGNFESLTDNKLNQKTGEFRYTQIWQPEKNAKFGDVAFENHTIGNLTYYSPVPNFFFYGTANGPLPCTNVNFVNYLEQKYHFIPQMRTTDLGDGFKSVYTTKNTN